jgi:UDP-N-acetylglucosamine 2-epimerase
MKAAPIVGARPNFVKLAPLSWALRAAGITERIIHNGRHYDYQMDRIFFDELLIPPSDHHLRVGSGSHGRQTGHLQEPSLTRDKYSKKDSFLERE